MNDKCYDPKATISDVEVICNTSYRTATRLMARLKHDLDIPKYVHPTLSQVRSYFRTYTTTMA